MAATAFGSHAYRHGNVSWPENLYFGIIAMKLAATPQFLNRNYIIETGDETFALSVNVPKRESNPALLPEAYEWTRLAPEETMVSGWASSASVLAAKRNQRRQFWWHLLAAGLVIALLEMLISNRTAL